MARATIYSLSRSDRRLVAAIEKQEFAIRALLETFLPALGFARHETVALLEPLGDSDNNYAARTYSPDIYEDRHFTLKTHGVIVDVFFGAKKIIIAVHSRTKVGNDVVNALLSFCEWDRSLNQDGESASVSRRSAQ